MFLVLVPARPALRTQQRRLQPNSTSCKPKSVHANVLASSGCASCNINTRKLVKSTPGGRVATNPKTRKHKQRSFINCCTRYVCYEIWLIESCCPAQKWEVSEIGGVSPVWGVPYYTDTIWHTLKPCTNRFPACTSHRLECLQGLVASGVAKPQNKAWGLGYGV